MRKSYSKQLRLDSLPVEQVTLNLESRDRIVPFFERFSLCMPTANLPIRWSH